MPVANAYIFMRDDIDMKEKGVMEGTKSVLKCRHIQGQNEEKGKKNREKKLKVKLYLKNKEFD